jgi:hypothetical protein
MHRTSDLHGVVGDTTGLLFFETVTVTPCIIVWKLRHATKVAIHWGSSTDDGVAVWIVSKGGWRGFARKLHARTIPSY